MTNRVSASSRISPACQRIRDGVLVEGFSATAFITLEQLDAESLAKLACSAGLSLSEEDQRILSRLVEDAEAAAIWWSATQVLKGDPFGFDDQTAEGLKLFIKAFESVSMMDGHQRHCLDLILRATHPGLQGMTWKMNEKATDTLRGYLKTPTAGSPIKSSWHQAQVVNQLLRSWETRTLRKVGKGTNRPSATTFLEDIILVVRCKVPRIRLEKTNRYESTTKRQADLSLLQNGWVGAVRTGIARFVRAREGELP